MPHFIDQVGGGGIDAHCFCAIKQAEQLLEMTVGLFVQVSVCGDLINAVVERWQNGSPQRQTQAD
ncbi:hypothetical protein [Thiorhodovibrio frisius]|uniref:hypothetical protein n=1 Tax=Thiorhodovibrio frisius TaxID=631362 RepID=UPI001CBD570C